MNVIETHNLTRFFGSKRAVLDLSLSIPKGHVYGLLGENASGKTTTINLIMGALVPNNGDIKIFGEDPLYMKPSTRARIGFLGDEMEVPAQMRLCEAKDLHSLYFESWDEPLYKRLMKEYELPEKQVFSTLSKGQKRRFMLALIAAQRPELLILDEPAGGLDVSVRRQFLDLLMELVSEQEITVLISSHILSDVERVVDHVAFIKKGSLVKQSPLDELKSHVKRLCTDDYELEGRMRDRFDVISREDRGNTCLMVVSDFEEEKLEGIECQVEHLNLEELFLIYNSPNNGKVRSHG